MGSEEVVEQGARLGVLLVFPSQLFTSYRLETAGQQKKTPSPVCLPPLVDLSACCYLLSPSFPTVEVVDLHHHGYAPEGRCGDGG